MSFGDEETTGFEDEQTALAEQLSAIRAEMLEAAGHWQPWITEREANRDASARNLLQYLSLRRHDLSAAQSRLIELGLSSMGDSEGHVQATIDAVLAALQALIERPPQPLPETAPIGFPAAASCSPSVLTSCWGRHAASVRHESW